MGVFSVWSLVLYLIVPLGLTLLLLLSFPPIDYRTEILNAPSKSLRRRWGFLRRYTNKLVEKVLFTRLGFLPADLISFLLVGLTIMLIVLGVRVYDDATKQHGIEKMLDVHLLQQSQVFRRQRNLYLTALALLTWYSVMVVHSLQVVLVSRDEALLNAISDKEVVNQVRRAPDVGHSVVEHRDDEVDDAIDEEIKQAEVELQPRSRSGARRAGSRKDR